MNSLFLVFISIALLLWGYLYYAKRLEKLWHIDPKKATPAFSKYDSIDYIPAKNWLVIFGHHFSSIAGAGPIVGPVIAVMLWGWLPAIIWVLLGTIFIGGVHDFGSLILSVREGGNSISDIAQHAISKRAKIIFSIFVWLALILVISVFAYFAAETFTKQPKIVLPSLGLIPIAIIMGFLLYQKNINTILATIFGLACLCALVFLGNNFPINGSLRLWIIILFVYCFFASVTPVNILLQPRDYLSSYLLIIGMLAGYVGIFLSKPDISLPAYSSWKTTEGYLWPAMFITVACGAVSGFHSLIASGTSSKQIANERHIKRISYGAMVAECLVAIMAIICVATIFKPQDNLLGILKNLGPVAIFGEAYGSNTKAIFGRYGSFIAITILNAFILTTLDSATRITRYLSQELFGIRNRYVATLIIVAVSSLLALSGKWSKLWPAFGASNQLVAALALLVISCWLLSKEKSMKFTLLPGLFMLITTVFALIMQGINYYRNLDITLLIITLALLGLSLFMIYEVSRSTMLFRRKKHA